MHTLKLIPGILGCLLLLGSPITASAGAHKQADAAGGNDTATCPAGKEGCPHQHKHSDKHHHGHGHKHGGYHGRGGPDGKGGMFGEEMNLSEQQKQDMAALMQIYGPRLGDIRKRGQENRRRLMGMNPDDPAYSGLTDSVAKEAAASASEVIILLAELQSNAYTLLTPEQQQKFGEFRQKMLDRMAEREAQRAEGKGRYGKEGFGKGGFGMWGHGKHGKRCDGENCPYRESGASDDTAEDAAEE